MLRSWKQVEDGSAEDLGHLEFEAALALFQSGDWKAMGLVAPGKNMLQFEGESPMTVTVTYYYTVPSSTYDQFNFQGQDIRTAEKMLRDEAEALIRLHAMGKGEEILAAL